MDRQEIKIKSTLDGSLQPSLFYKSKTNGKRPLLVGLHTWCCSRYNQVKNLLPIAEELDFNLLLPEFRGGNSIKNPDCRKACGSEFAKQDIKDAIDYLIENEEIDQDNIFLLGASGGGHMALLMAGMCPEYFRAIGACVPVTDFVTWEKLNPDFSTDVRACCGNDETEMIRRSPITYIDTIAKANLKIFHGKFDTVVPVSQSLEFYNTMMKKHPTARVFLDVFDGEHEFDIKTAMHWIKSQYIHEEKIKVTS